MQNQSSRIAYGVIEKVVVLPRSNPRTLPTIKDVFGGEGLNVFHNIACLTLLLQRQQYPDNAISYELGEEDPYWKSGIIVEVLLPCHDRQDDDGENVQLYFPPYDRISLPKSREGQAEKTSIVISCHDWALTSKRNRQKDILRTRPASEGGRIIYSLPTGSVRLECLHFPGREVISVRVVEELTTLPVVQGSKADWGLNVNPTQSVKQ